MANKEIVNPSELSEVETLKANIQALEDALKAAESKVRDVDTLFSSEHQAIIGAKYEPKYKSDARRKHRELFPQFIGNPFMLYLLAETLGEARKAVFSANIKTYLRKLGNPMEDWTPVVPGAVLTDLQVRENKETDRRLELLRAEIEDEDDRIALCKKYAEQLKMGNKTAKDTERNRAVFFHAADSMGVIPNTIW